MKKISFIFIISFFVSQGFTQTFDRNNWYINCDMTYGAAIPEYQFIRSIVDKNIQQVEFSVFKKTYGTNFWEQIYKYPKIGISLFYSTLGNQAVLGNEIAIFPYILIPSFPSKKIHIENKIGLGLGFATKKFDLSDNYQNVAVGSRLNIHFNYHLGFEYEITPRFNLNSGINFNHFSNANMKEPNLGINLVSVSLGCSKLISEHAEYLQAETPVLTGKNEILLFASLGGKHTRALQSDIYFTSSIALEFNRRLSHVFRFGTGLDLFYDSSTEVEMSVSPGNSFKTIYNYRSGVHIAQEFIYNHFSFILQEGLYIGLVDEVSHKRMYNKMILRYRWSEHFVTQLAVKSHLHILDFPELGFAYHF